MSAPVLAFVVSCAGYLGFAELGYWLKDASSGLASFWPSAGLIVGLLVRLPARLRGWCVAAVLPSEVLSDSIHGAPLVAGLGWAAVVVMEVVTAAVVLVLVARRSPRGDTSRDFFALAAAAFTVPGLAGLAGGAVSHAVFGGPFFTAWLTWWLGDATGILLVVPLVLSVARTHSGGLGWKALASLIEVGLVIGVVVAVFQLTRSDLQLLVMPPLVLVAVNRGLLLTAIASVANAVAATVLTGAGRGPLADAASSSARVLALDSFIATTAFVAFLICAAMAQRREAEENATQLATHDALTGLSNRRRFISQLEHVTRRRVRSGEQAAVLYCDLDRFKEINDALGHAAGDALLTEVAARLSSAVRASDLVARIGGDEFAVLLEPVDGLSGAQNTAPRVTAAVERPFKFKDVLIPIRVSVGIALVGDDPDMTLAQADADLYCHKARRHAAYATT